MLEDVEVKLVQHAGSDESVVAAARVSVIGPESEEYLSTPATESKGLVGFLMKNRHGSPFEHNSMTFLVRAPIFVFREFHRHRVGWSYNEMSGRYTELKPEFYAPSKERPLVQTGKPGHYVFVPGDDDLQWDVHVTLVDSYQHAWDDYQSLLNRGVAKEIARLVLPVGIFSAMYATCNARSLMHFLSLRTKHSGSWFPSYPQREIEMVAEKMEAEFERLFPITYEAWNANGRVAP